MIRLLSSVLLVGAGFLLMGCPAESKCEVDGECLLGESCQAGACVLSTPDGGGGSGLRCPDTSHPSAPNVLNNPGFECGTDGWDVALEGFGAVTHETETVHSGSGAIRLTATNTASAKLLHLATIENPAPGSIWCAEVWVRGTASDAWMWLGRELPGRLEGKYVASPVLANEWSKAPNNLTFSVKVEPGDTGLILYATIPNPVTGTYVIFDDFALWQSRDGSCRER